MVSSVLLLAPLVFLDHLRPTIALAVLAGIPMTSGITTYAIKALDQESIVSVRRMFGLALASNLIWLIPVVAGSALSWTRHDAQPLFDEFVLGAFIAWSFELLVINGAFVSSTARSFVMAALQPLVTLLLVASFIARVNMSIIYSATLGFVVLAIDLVFLLKFKTFKAEGIGVSSLQTFQSFLKTWVSQKPGDLEKYFTMYSREQRVSTNILLVQGANKAALVLPGVHPGPFFPVGSYNISELIFHELRNNDLTPMVLHGVGGHERNLPTNELAKRYASAVSLAARSHPIGHEAHTMRGPDRHQIGPTLVTSLSFADNTIAFLSNAPYNTDDLQPDTIDHALSSANAVGVSLALVDAHNSIGGESVEQPELDWSRILSDLRGTPEAEFEVGFAHSSELNFQQGSDISDGGITAMVLRKSQSTYALITCDSNNAVMGLRQAVADDLKTDQVELIELCTSDTHNSAARSLTSRGYHALGEDTSWTELLALIKRLEKLAEGRLSRGKVTMFTTDMQLPLIGDKSLEDFAALAKEALDFTKTYAAGAIAATILACVLALFL